MTHMYLIWAAVIIFGIIAEVMTAQLVSIWFVAGAVAAILMNAFMMPEWGQLLVFASVTLLLLALTRPFLQKKLAVQKTSTNADRYIGGTGIVVEDIDNLAAQGQVFIGGSLWTARSESDSPIEKDTEVIIIRIEGVKAIVQPKRETSHS